MPETVAGLCDAGQLTSAIDYVSEALALVCSRAPATEVALMASVLRDLLAQLHRFRLANEVLRMHGDERYADGVEDGMSIGRAALLAEQAAEAAERRSRFHVVRPQRATGSFPVLPRAAADGT